MENTISVRKNTWEHSKQWHKIPSNLKLLYATMPWCRGLIFHALQNKGSIEILYDVQLKRSKTVLDKTCLVNFM